MNTAIADAPSIDAELPLNERRTAEEFLQRPDLTAFELVDGQLVERAMAQDSSEVEMNLAYLLKLVVTPNQLGWVYPSSSCYRCFEGVTGDRDRLRKPDVSFIAQGRLTVEDKRSSVLKTAPDLAVEVVSLNENVMELDEKISEYLGAGVKLVWVINPRAETVSIYRQDGSAARLNANGELSGEDVIPGFKCKVAELFASLKVA